MNSALDGIHIVKSLDGYWYASGDGGASFKEIPDARPCKDPLLASADLFTHKGIGWNVRNLYRVSCGRTGCGASDYAKTRAEAERACVAYLEKRSTQTKVAPKELLWSAIAEAIKNTGITPRYSWVKDSKSSNERRRP